MFYCSSSYPALFDENLVYGPLVLDPCFNVAEIFKFAASIEEEGTVSDSVPLGFGSGRFVGCFEGFLELKDMTGALYYSLRIAHACT